MDGNQEAVLRLLLSEYADAAFANSGCVDSEKAAEAAAVEAVVDYVAGLIARCK